MVRQLEKLEQQKAKVILTLSEWPDKQLQFRPQPTAWSALEVLDHVVKVEQAFVDEVGANLSKGHAVTLGGRFRGLMVNAVMRSPLRVKVPAGVEQVLPKLAGNLDSISASWGETRRKLCELLRQIPANRLSVGVFRHPVSGWLPLGRAVAFLSAHLRHHEYQLNRLERAARRF